MGEAGAMPPDARANRGRWQTMGEVEPLTLARFREGPESELYVDAIFGTGLTRPPQRDLLDLLRHLAGRDGAQYVSRLVAVDAPSGARSRHREHAGWRQRRSRPLPRCRFAR